MVPSGRAENTCFLATLYNFPKGGGGGGGGLPLRGACVILCYVVMPYVRLREPDVPSLKAEVVQIG